MIKAVPFNLPRRANFSVRHDLRSLVQSVPNRLHGNITVGLHGGFRGISHSGTWTVPAAAAANLTGGSPKMGHFTAAGLQGIALTSRRTSLQLGPPIYDDIPAPVYDQDGIQVDTGNCQGVDSASMRVALIDAGIYAKALSLVAKGPSSALFSNYFFSGARPTASYIHGQPYNGPRQAFDDQDELHASSDPTSIGGLKDVLHVRIIHTDSGEPIIPQAAIAFNETGREYSISLIGTFKPKESAWPITLELTKMDGTKFTASTELNYLTNPKGPQSMTRIDSLRGGLQIRSYTPEWEPFFPYSFYLGGPWLESSPGNMKRFKELGYNVLHIIPNGEGIGYDLEQLDKWFDEAEQLGLWIMFDMRWTYKNFQYVKIQVERYKSRKNMLLWYTADEPDGHQDSPDAPGRIYPQIKSLDPYHPISLCLNCQNYFFQDYTAGTDIIMTDTYPIGTNTEYSTKY
ncbi:MAG: hypothetical protein Q9188_005789, partial [Gyalolechia gomerana]